MSCSVLETKSIELNVFSEVTPSRKRKRESECNAAAATKSSVTTTCFTNAAFSSTPKKIIGRRRQLSNGTNVNHKAQPVENPCLEVKSIADILQKNVTASQESQESTTNPYEVIRKPPKKKKRQASIEEACFENPALNLEVPDKQFNPYEVVRPETAVTPIKSSCFVNSALNIRGQDKPCNPYEIQRCSKVAAETNQTACVENTALEEAVAAAQPCGLKIGLPFTPTLGCRIDFTNLSLTQLTPSKLLADKLVFSPLTAPKRSLDAISEESSSMDIGRELDRYQLELENSINEAKLRKNDVAGGELDTKLHVEPQINLPPKLEDIAEATTEEEEREQKKPTEIVSKAKVKVTIEVETICSEQENQSKEPNNNDDVAYASDTDEEDDLDFKAPVRFVRAYRRAPSPKLAVSKESLNSIKSTQSADAADKKPINVKNFIRKSIRKLMHPSESNVVETQSRGSNILSSIRHSLRRKPGIKLLLEDNDEVIDETPVKAEISIVDTSERTIKLKSSLAQNEFARVEHLTLEKKNSLRHSLRRSTRGLGQQLMKTVFHKEHEEYALRK